MNSTQPPFTPQSLATIRGRLENAVKLEPTVVNANLALIAVTMRQGEYKAACDYAVQALDSIPGNPALMSAVESAMTLGRHYQGHAGISPTRAEYRVLDLIMKGMNNRQIAELLHRSVRTVEVHSARVRAKFGVSNKIDLVRRVMEMKFAKDKQSQ